MSDRQQDADLRALFAAQRRVDAGEAPSFAETLARARSKAADAGPAVTSRRFRLRRFVYVSGLAAAAAIAGLMVWPRSPSPNDAFERAVRAFENDPALGAWRSPTDGLLDVPGLQLMTTVPSVGIQ
jgi:hypothetical protein